MKVVKRGFIYGICGLMLLGGVGCDDEDKVESRYTDSLNSLKVEIAPLVLKRGETVTVEVSREEEGSRAESDTTGGAEEGRTYVVVFSESLGFADSVLVPGVVEKVMEVKGEHDIGVRYEPVRIDVSNVGIEIKHESKTTIVVE